MTRGLGQMVFWPNIWPNRASLLSAVAMICAGVMLCTGAQAQSTDDLCPDIHAAKQNTPGNTSDMQASIERLNLCVERGRLLKQLDEIARQRDEILNKVTQTSIGVDAHSITGVPALSSAALPALPTDVTGLNAGDVKIVGAAANPLDGARAASQAESSVIKKPAWKVRKIWGQGASMRAQISDGTGTLLNVVRGDVMPDDSIVESVSVKGVAISHNGKINDLPWDDTGL